MRDAGSCKYSSTHAFTMNPDVCREHLFVTTQLSIGHARRTRFGWIQLVWGQMTLEIMGEGGAQKCIRRAGGVGILKRGGGGLAGTPSTQGL